MTLTADLNSRAAKLYKMLAIIHRCPGLRATEINRVPQLQFSWNLRLALLQRKLIRTEDDGSATRYFPAQSSS